MPMGGRYGGPWRDWRKWRRRGIVDDIDGSDLNTVEAGFGQTSLYGEPEIMAGLVEW